MFCGGGWRSTAVRLPRRLRRQGRPCRRARAQASGM